MRSSIRLLSAASAVTLSAVLAACGTADPYGPNNYPVSPLSSTSPPGTYPAGTYPPGSYPAQPVAAVEYGRITNVSLVSAGSGPSPNRSAAGGVLGAIVGGLLGNQIGQGGGRGREYNVSNPVYRVTVQTDQGYMRNYDVSATGDLRIGDRVRIENGVIYLA
jgi:outer membrane lipoprotein SlyB